MNTTTFYTPTNKIYVRITTQLTNSSSHKTSYIYICIIELFVCVCVCMRGDAESVQQRNGQETTRKRFETVISTMDEIEEVRRVFGVPCPSTIRVKILVGELKNLRYTGEVLKLLLDHVPPPAKVRVFFVFRRVTTANAILFCS